MDQSKYKEQEDNLQKLYKIIDIMKNYHKKNYDMNI